MMKLLFFGRSRHLFKLILLLAAIIFPTIQGDQHELASPAHKSLLIAAGCFWCAEQAFEQYAPGVKEVVSGERDELMSIMLSSLNESVKDLGVEIIDFRVKRIDLPSNLSNSVYERMRTERQRLAEELRSEGKEIAREIRAIADKDKVVILAEAYKLSEQLRGEGDATSASIYAESFSQDPEFYEFTRSMKAYVETFENKSDVMLIDSDSEFFKYLNAKKNLE